jgi:acyl-coenzyme A thioesterase PaaI-like protein
MRRRMAMNGSPDLQPEEGWSAIDVGKMIARTSAFVSGPGNGDRLRVRYFRCEPEGTLAAKAWFGPDAEGLPGQAHSGSVAAVLDEAMALASWLSGHRVVAGTITVHFRQILPLGVVCTIGAWVTAVNGREVHARAVLAEPAGQAFADAEGLYNTIVPAPLHLAPGSQSVSSASR